jgi:hypothetical protein
MAGSKGHGAEDSMVPMAGRRLTLISLTRETKSLMRMSGQAASVRNRAGQYHLGHRSRDGGSASMFDFTDCIEAHITGITMLEESKTINISLRGQAKQCFMLVIEGVDRLVANEFREQNIVDRVVLWDLTSEPNEYRASLAALVSGASEDQIEDTWQPLIEKEIASIQQGEKVFVSIEPVYGVWIVLLARKVTVMPQRRQSE